LPAALRMRLFALLRRFLAIRLAVAALRRSPSVRAVYLRGGCALDRIVPGISDVDFVIFADTRAGVDTHYMTRYRRVARWLPILEAWPAVYDALDPQLTYDRRAHHHYHWHTGREGWRLVYGEDLLRDVKLRSGSDLHLGILSWAAVFFDLPLRGLWSTSEPHPDRLLATSLLVRSAAVILQMELSVERAEPLSTRHAALEAGEAALPEEAGFLAELGCLEARTYRGAQPGLDDRTGVFLLRRINGLLGRMRTGRFSAAAAAHPEQVVHAPDGTLAELALSSAETELLELGVRRAREEWGDSYRAAYAAPTVFHSIGDMVVAIEIDAGRPPSAEQLRRWKRSLPHGAGPRARQVLFYLLLPEGAVHVGDAPLSGRVERILHPAAVPDFFALLHREEFCLDGVGTPPEPPAVVTEGMLHLLRESVWRLDHPGLRPGQPRPERADVAAAFWKRLQVALVDCTIGGARIEYPVTPAAIERRLIAVGLPLPASLQPLRDAAVDVRSLPHAEEIRGPAERYLREALESLRGCPGRSVDRQGRTVAGAGFGQCREDGDKKTIGLP
jgi:hypothetical protein